MKNTRLLFVIWMLFLVLPQGYSQGKKEDSSVLGQVNGFLSNLGISFLVPYTKDFGRITQF